MSISLSIHTYIYIYICTICIYIYIYTYCPEGCSRTGACEADAQKGHARRPPKGSMQGARGLFMCDAEGGEGGEGGNVGGMATF